MKTELQAMARASLGTSGCSALDADMSVRSVSHSVSISAQQRVENCVDDLRNLLCCKICVRLLYEPYTISCGHTFCYSCLNQWFASNKVKKTCPDCRAPVTQQPAPAYLIREMTQIFINRAELVPEGETKEDLQKCQKEEAGIVENDKLDTDRATGGLFRGCFRSTRHPRRMIVDTEDGVSRCPICTWELEYGICGQCNIEFDSDGNAYDVEELSGSEAFTESEDSESGSDFQGSSIPIAGEELQDDDFDGNIHTMHNFNDMIRRRIRHQVHQRSPVPPQRSYSRSVLSDLLTHSDSTAGETDRDSGGDAGSLEEFVINDDDADHDNWSADLSIHPIDRDSLEHSDYETEASDRMHTEADHDPIGLDEDSDEGGAIFNGRRRRLSQRQRSTQEDDSIRGHANTALEDHQPHHNCAWDGSSAVSQEGWSPLQQSSHGGHHDTPLAHSLASNSPGHSREQSHYSENCNLSRTYSLSGDSADDPTDAHMEPEFSMPRFRVGRRRNENAQGLFNRENEPRTGGSQRQRDDKTKRSGTATSSHQSPTVTLTGSSPASLSHNLWPPTSPILINSSPARPQAVASSAESLSSLERVSRSSPSRGTGSFVTTRMLQPVHPGSPSVDMFVHQGRGHSTQDRTTSRSNQNISSTHSAISRRSALGVASGLNRRTIPHLRSSTPSGMIEPPRSRSPSADTENRPSIDSGRYRRRQDKHRRREGLLQQRNQHQVESRQEYLDLNF